MDLVGLDARLEMDAGPNIVPLSRSQIRQVVNNLIVNARVHGAPPIDVAIRRTGTAAVLTVTDAGSGMSPEFLTIACERFTRGDDARSRQGTGLGLALVDAIMRNHGGETRLCSNGHHHRSSEALGFTCRHQAHGTTATAAFPVAPEPSKCVVDTTNQPPGRP